MNNTRHLIYIAALHSETADADIALHLQRGCLQLKNCSKDSVSASATWQRMVCLAAAASGYICYQQERYRQYLSSQQIRLHHPTLDLLC